MPKNMNPANVPQLRPIEKYWALMKQKLRKSGRSTSDIDQFKKLYSATSRKMTKSAVQTLMAGVKTKLRKYCDQVVDEQI